MRQFFFTLILICTAFTVQAQNITRKVTMEWESIEDSTSYELEFRRYLPDGSLKKPNLFRTKTTSWSGAIQPGKYQIRIRSQDDREVWGDWGAPFDHWVRPLPPDLVAPQMNEVLAVTDKTTSKVLFQWTSKPGNASYKVQVFDENNQEVASQTTTDLQLTLELPVARRYQWHVLGLMGEGKELSEEPKQKNIFTIRGGPLPTPEIFRPEDAFVEKLSWGAIPEAKEYQVTLWHIDGAKKAVQLQKWSQLKKTELRVNPRFPGGTWHLEVQATADLNAPSEIARLEFDVYDGLRTSKAIAVAKRRQSIERARDNYLLFSYLLTSLNYNAKFSDLSGAGLKFNAISGTGRLGYGRFGRKAQWGLLTTLDYGGVIINGKNHTYGSMEAQALWRTYFSGVTQLRLSSGLAYREHPEAKGLNNQNLRVSNLSLGEVTFGMQLWHPLSKKIGIQLNQQTWYSIMGFTMPAGASLKPSLSYQFGALGSYKWRENITALAGYAYRHEETSYQPRGTTGTSTIELNGHYLNLYLEWGF